MQRMRTSLLSLAVYLFIFTTLVVSHSERFHLHPMNKKLGTKALNRPQVEIHLKNIRAITDSGVNAEAYWSFDGYVTLEILV